MSTSLLSPSEALQSWLHSIIGNWGWAIIAMTVIIKSAFYPLNHASARSMAKMKVIAPKLNEPDIDEFPEHLLEDIEFVFADHVEKVLSEALEPERQRQRRPTAVRRTGRERAAAKGR